MNRTHQEPIGDDQIADAVGPAGTEYRLRSNASGASMPVLEGRFIVNHFGLRLGIHASDAVERRGGFSEITLSPALTVSLVLDGRIDAMLGDHPLQFCATREPVGHVWAFSSPLVLRRNLSPGEHVRKVNISLPGEWNRWLAEEECGFVLHRWQPTRRSIRCAEDILALQEGSEHPMFQLRAMELAVQIVQDALESRLPQAWPAQPGGNAGDRNIGRARYVRQYIVDNCLRPLSLTDIADATRMSISTLQRLFKASFGVTVMDFVRTCRLREARRWLTLGEATIAEAAFEAGYSNPSNFTTAFTREFGYPPSACLACK